MCPAKRHVFQRTMKSRPTIYSYRSLVVEHCTSPVGAELLVGLRAASDERVGGGNALVGQRSAAVGAARHRGQTASSHHRVAVERTQRGCGHCRAGDEKAHGEG